MTNTYALCERTDLPLDMCVCDLCQPETHGVATFRSLCGYCTGRIQVGERIVKPAGEPLWWHEECGGQ